MRISTSLPDGKWRDVAEAARAFEELGFDEAAAIHLTKLPQYRRRHFDPLS